MRVILSSLLLLMLLALPLAASAGSTFTPVSPEQTQDPIPDQTGQSPAEPLQPIERAFGMTLGEPLPLNSKQIMNVASPGPGLERFMLLFIPAPRAPYAHYYATVHTATRRVVEIMAVSRSLGSEEKTWKAFNAQITKLGKLYGKGMRLGGGSIWKVVRFGRFVELRISPGERKVQVVYSMQQSVAP